MFDIPRSRQQGYRLLDQFPEQQALYTFAIDSMGVTQLRNGIPGKGWG